MDHLPPDPTSPPTPLAPLAPLSAVHVVVPAHDEEERVGACLVSVLAAVETLAASASASALRIEVCVVLDRCADATALVVAGLGVEGLPVTAGTVGAARRAGVRHVAAQTGDLAPDRVLVVNTDADCTVPTTWLLDHVDLARDHHLVQGGVRPDPQDLTPAARAAWALRFPAGRGSLHGANLGVRLDAYLAVGGFPEVATREDLLLVRALKAAGYASVCGTEVTTSGRRQGRAPDGFAAYLRAFDLELAALDASLDLPAHAVRG